MQIRKKGDEIKKKSSPRKLLDLNVIFYQNMPNLHNLYISAERKISQKNKELSRIILILIYYRRLTRFK
jgi:hypothetical protein